MIFRSVVLASVVASGVMLSSNANAGLVFDFDFSQGSQTTGFNDPTLGAARRNALITAGALFSQNVFGKYFSNSATITIDARGTGSTNDDGGVASAGTGSFSISGFGNGEIVRNKILSGVDLDGADNDGFVNVSFARNFQLDPNAPVDFGAGQLDFFSVIDHELTHALGFLSFIDGTTTQTSFSKFDQFLTTTDGTPLVDPTTGTLNTTAYNLANDPNNNATVVADSGARFAGTNAIADYGTAVPIEGAGGALSHLGTYAFTTPHAPINGLMLCCGNPYQDDSVEPRDYNSAEVGILTDLGYTRNAVVIAVPEPATWLITIGGFAAVVGSRMRRRTVAASIS